MTYGTFMKISMTCVVLIVIGVIINTTVYDREIYHDEVKPPQNTINYEECIKEKIDNFHGVLYTNGMVDRVVQHLMKQCGRNDITFSEEIQRIHFELMANNTWKRGRFQHE